MPFLKKIAVIKLCLNKMEVPDIRETRAHTWNRQINMFFWHLQMAGNEWRVTLIWTEFLSVLSLLPLGLQ